MDAFDPAEGPVIAKLALDLLTDDTAKPVVALVAEEDDRIAGMIIFSPVSIIGCEDVTAYILAPLAVLKERQRKGIGRALVQQGMMLIEQAGAGLVLVYGDPDYYTRAGFCSDHNIKAPYKLTYPRAWMAKAFQKGLLETIRGTVRCAAALNAPEHW